MKKLLSLFCALSLSAALLAGCSGGNGDANATADGAESTSPTVTEPETTTPEETSAPVDVNVMALKGPTAMGMVEFMSQADAGELTDNNYHFSITAVTDEVSTALAQGTTDLAAVPANLASVLYNNTEGGVRVLASIPWVCFTSWKAATPSTLWRICGARPSTPAEKAIRRNTSSTMC